MKSCLSSIASAYTVPDGVKHTLPGEELPEEVERCKGDIWPLGDSTAFLDRLEGLLNLPVELLRRLDFSSYSHGLPEVGEQTLDST